MKAPTMMKNTLGKRSPLSRAAPPALVIRLVALATVEPKSHLILPPT
jgi:hypothetical protein